MMFPLQHWQNSPAVKLDPELREHKDRYTHGDPRKEHERQTVAIALNQENVPGVLERPRSD